MDKRNYSQSQIEKLVTDIRIFMETHQNPVLVQKYSRYFVEGYDAYGVESQVLAEQKKKWLEVNGVELGLEGFLDLGDRLVAGGKYEEVFLAYWFIQQYPEHLSLEVFSRLASWLENGICNWAMVDSFSMDLAAPFLIKGLVGLDGMVGWRVSSSKWMRRAVPVSLIKPAKGVISISDILKFITPLMLDKEKVVHQGLGWLLRELWKQEPKTVEEFLLEWKDTCARLIIQYATEKMTGTEKERFRRSRTSLT
jgi:3-methyladenine DNA glycosylase AlkD